jgi:hypothetical protein
MDGGKRRLLAPHPIAKTAMAGTLPVQVALQKAQDRIFDDPTTMLGG